MHRLVIFTLCVAFLSSSTLGRRLPFRELARPGPCDESSHPSLCRRRAANAFRDVLEDVVREYRRRSAGQPVSDRLLAAIRRVETGGTRCDNTNPCDVTGDGGLALGPYQIHRVYYQDAVEFRPSLAGTPYSGVTDKDFAEQVIQAYMSRYATERRLRRPVTDEDIARIHNGGPNGYKKSATLGYWRKVQGYLRG